MAQPDRLEGAPDAAVGVDGVERRHRNLSVTLAHSRDGTHTLALSAKPGAVRFLRTMASVRPPREPAADDDDASMQAPDVTYLQRVAAAQRSAAQHGCSAVLR
jgi:hypothetical protein